MPLGKKTYNLKITDPIRLALNSYWISGDFVGSSELFDISYTTPVTSQTGYYWPGITTKQTITLTPKPGVFLDPPTIGNPTGQNATFIIPQTFEDYLNSLLNASNIIDGQTLGAGLRFKDIVFVNELPEVTKDFSTTSDPASSAKFVVNEQFLINFDGSAVDKKYEDAASDPSVSELSLINFYSATVQGVDTDGDGFDDNLQLIDNDAALDDYIEAVLSPPILLPQYENVIFPMDNYEDLMALNSYADLYPLENIVSPYGGQTINKLYDAINDTDLDLALVNTIMMYRASEDTATDLNSLKTNLAAIPILGGTLSAGSFEVSTQIFSPPELVDTTENLAILNIYDWSTDLIDVIDFIQGNATTGNKIYPGGPPGDDSLEIVSDSSFPDQTLAVLSEDFNREVSEIVLDNLRSFEDINRGRPSHSSIIFFKIEKRSDPNSLEPIQTFWIPNHKGSYRYSPIEYVDTQVKYNKNYFYSVFAYNMVVGTEYYYVPLWTTEDAPGADPLRPGEIVTEDPNSPVGLAAPHTHWVGEKEVQTTQGAVTKGGAGFIHENEDTTTLEEHDHGESVQLRQPWDNENWGDLNSNGITTIADLPTSDDEHDHCVILEPSSAGFPQGRSENPGTKCKVIKEVNPFGAFEVITTPTVDLIESHLFDFDGDIVSDPPIAPDVLFIPYIGIDNRITLSMQALIGEYENRAVILDSTDADYIDALRNARGLGPNDLITYKSDDQVAGFEIYRTETRPSSYEDFAGKFRDSISTLQRSSFEYIYAWDTAYKDKVVPNTTYYYMVRAVDVHGARSFPSSVYKVQMVNDAGTVYPLIEVVDMVPPPKPQTKTKNFKKFLQLVPAIAQKMIDYQKSDLLTTDGQLKESATAATGLIDLGITEPKLFGTETDPKIIKIRLISKNTGKKIDLNVAFKVENEK